MIYLTSEQKQALDIMLSGRNVFLTGRGGTGKSSIIKAFLKQRSQRVACLAPTGIAARNLPNGVTIHNFFQLSPSGQFSSKREPYLRRLCQATKTIIIDEISMVRSDVFSLIDRMLRGYGYGNQPFGGKQIIVVGDFHQLPPVIDDENIRRYLEAELGGIYAFNTEAWRQADFMSIELQQIHRQTDHEYIKLLEAVRSVSPDLSSHLNKCAVADDGIAPDRIGICCTREGAAAINNAAMDMLPDIGITSHGESDGYFPENEFPTERELTLKRGEKVMLLANQQTPFFNKYDYVNGDIGIVEDFDRIRGYVSVRLLESQRLLAVHPATWLNYEYQVQTNFSTGELSLISKVIGSFRQLPLAPAYAMTIHKSQGQTLNKIHLVLGRGCFAPGQLYTALSRIRKFTDLTLDRPIQFREAMNDPQVTEFYRVI